jgi:hypothetical protein
MKFCYVGFSLGRPEEAALLVERHGLEVPTPGVQVHALEAALDCPGDGAAQQAPANAPAVVVGPCVKQADVAVEGLFGVGFQTDVTDDLAAVLGHPARVTVAPHEVAHHVVRGDRHSAGPAARPARLRAVAHVGQQLGLSLPTGAYVPYDVLIPGHSSRLQTIPRRAASGMLRARACPVNRTAALPRVASPP